MKPALFERPEPATRDTLRPGPLRGPLRRRLRRGMVPYWFLSPTVLLMSVLMLLPIMMVIGYSVMDNVIVNQNPVVAGLSNYREVLTDGVFHTAVGNTLFFVIVSVCVHLVLGLLFAILLNSRLISNTTKAIFRALFIVPWLFTVAIIAVLWRLLLNPNGVINYLLISGGLTDTGIEWLSSRGTALYAVTFINIWAGYPFFMVSLLAGLQGIPQDLYEAARVDGSTGIQAFRYITIPQLKPIIISMALLDFIWTSQQFALIWLTTGGGPIISTEVVSTYTYKLAFSRNEFSLASTSAVLILIASMLLAYLYARHQKAQD